MRAMKGVYFGPAREAGPEQPRGSQHRARRRGKALDRPAKTEDSILKNP